ncbi:ROK family protein [Paenibacillus sp. MWE-103]|uniref:ROK family protein n=1 Tax=Paenibacillus artemisiicola TaxID=1172618 RepID=A0ABS3W4P4_9BACL|nr:ROK family protein [Paenibacillus artemisiicola]MBO7743264.1 ROK family protein [Paenibacillus artemisiicola]
MESIYIGIDLGGTKMLAAIVDERGNMLARTRQETRADRGPVDTIERMKEMAVGLLAETFASPAEYALRGIGIAVAGILDPDRGNVVLATNLKWENVSLARPFVERFACPVQLLNDANAAALGEWMAGAGKNVNDLIFVTVSTGIGGGIVSGGRLVLGASDSAAELGHISIDRHGPLCACGNRGCIELYASGSSIARIAREEMLGGAQGGDELMRLTGGYLDRLTAEHVASAAAAGSAYAINKLAKAGTALGLGIVSMIHLLNPKMIVVGGGVSRSGPPLLEPMREAVRKYGIPGMVNGVTFETAKLGEDAGAVGAALWWRYADLPVSV